MKKERSPETSPGAPSVADGALLVELVAWNARARRATEMSGAADIVTEAATCRREAERAWVALLQQTHGTSVAYLHVHQFYNRVLVSLRRPPSDSEGLAEPAHPFDGGEIDRALAEPGVLAVPYELTREFFARLRIRDRPWRDEGDEKFHRYLARCAKWVAVGHKREIGLVARRAPASAAAIAGGADGRRVKGALLDALLVPEVLSLLAEASWLPDATREVLRRQFTASSAAGASRGARPVSPQLLHPALAEALDRLAADNGFVPAFAPSVEALVGPLLRSRSAWKRSWPVWCAGLDPQAIRDLARAQMVDVDTLPAAHQAAVACAVCDCVLPAILARYATVLARAHAAAPTFIDHLDRTIIEEGRAGLSGATIAAKHGITPALVHKRRQRFHERVAEYIARTLPGLVLGTVTRPPTSQSDA